MAKKKKGFNLYDYIEKTSLRNILTMNIGTILFGFLSIYILISVLFYFFSGSIERYQVISGPLSRNETYTGILVCEEHIEYAGASGYLNYYTKDGDKINANGIVYSISSTRLEKPSTELSYSELRKIRKEMSNFSYNYNSSNFNQIYSLKNSLEGSVLRYSDSEKAGVSGVSYKASTDGIILYSRDGYEGKRITDIVPEDFNQNTYHEIDMKTEEAVLTGDPVYTIITNEEWNLVIPLTDKQSVELASRTTIRVKFLKDNLTQTGEFQIMELDGKRYGVITFDKGLIRYASDRFLDIELVTNSLTGLKIPKSAITKKDFYVIPAEYMTKDDDGNPGVMKMTSERSSTFVPVTLYGRKQKEREDELLPGQQATYVYYIDMMNLKDGDILGISGTTDRFGVSEMIQLDGVYCFNKGYAQFRYIELLDENDEFAIVDPETNYGLVLYDQIVSDYTQLRSGDIVY